MTDKVKNQAPGSGKRDSFESESFDRKSISEICKKADQGEAMLFSDKLFNKSNNQSKDEKLGSYVEPSKGSSLGAIEKVDNFSGADTSALSGGVILDSMQFQRVDPVSPEAAQVIKSIGVQVAEKIIATYEALNAKQEVRITLQDGVLKDTEVLISKDGKSLNVSFVTGSQESADILNHRSGDLRTQLMDKFDDLKQVDVEVEHQNSSDNQDNDGRSHNRFGNQEEQEEEDKQN